MLNLVIKVFGYIFLRYFVFFAILYATDDNVKLVKGSDLKTGEDWFYFIWLFFVPTAIEAILFTYPFSYGLNKISTSQNKLGVYAVFLVLFLVEFVFSSWLYGIQSSLLKVTVSLILFFAFFWRRLL